MKIEYTSQGASPRRYGSLLVIWSALVGGSMLWTMHQESQNTLDIADAAARANISKDIGFRRWATSHGGVYVPPTEHTPPNPYLKVPERDVVTTTGKKLTLMNPAYMLRELQTDFPGEYGNKSHITSLKLLNPKNAPDAWEAEALHAFDRGEKERREVQQIDGQPYLRMMRPLIAEAGCLKCHGFQGYKVGEIRGGLSTTVALKPYLVRERELKISLALTHGGIWLIGLAGLGFSYRRDRSQSAEREKTAKALNDSQEKFSAISAAVLDALIMVDDNSTLVYWNPAAERILGYRADEVLGKPLHQMLTPQRYQSTAIKGFNEFRSTGLGAVIGKTVEIEAVHKNGREIPIELSISALKLNDKWHAVGILRDITERKHSEEALFEAQQIFRTLVENSPDIITRYDRDCRRTYVNPTYLSVSGMQQQELLGSTPDQHSPLPASSAAVLQKLLRKVLDSGTVEEVDIKWTRQDNVDHWFNIYAYPEFDREGQVVSVMTISRDITGRKLAEEEIRELNSELEQRVTARTADLEAANKELESFAYSVSHDLRTPLRAIDGFSHILLDDYADKLDDEGKRLLGVVRDNTSRMGRLIEDILKFSRSSRVSITCSEIDMDKIAHEVMAELQPIVAGGKLQLEIEHLPPARGDSALMHQVFINLLTNAVKFSRTKETQKIRVGFTAGDDETIYYVKDNGVGFDMQYADKLFGAFQRLHSENEFEGSGIGLAIVKRIITRHGGRVWAEGRINEGATLYFALPHADCKNDKHSIE